MYEKWILSKQESSQTFIDIRRENAFRMTQLGHILANIQQNFSYSHIPKTKWKTILNDIYVLSAINNKNEKRMFVVSLVLYDQTTLNVFTCIAF